MNDDRTDRLDAGLSQADGRDSGETAALSERSHLCLEFIAHDGDWPDTVTADAFGVRIASAIASVLAFDESDRAVVALGSDAEVRQLNSRYRGKDKPTNVLSFPAPEAPHIEPGGETVTFLGDVILARETVAREADEQGLAFEHHAAHLVIHGVLHLLGYDHEAGADAEEMEALEIEILGILGIENPYTEELVDAG